MALTINGETIPDEVVDQEFTQIKSHYEQMLQVSCCERDPEFLGYAKDNIIGRVLLSQHARADFPEPTADEIAAAIKRLFEEHGGEDAFYAAMGMPYKDENVLKENVAQSIRVDKLVAKACEPLPEPGDEELKAHYEEHLDLFKTVEEVRASHVTKNLGGAASRTEVYDQLRSIRERVRKAGEDFTKLAEAENDNKEQETDLGFFKQGEFMEEFEAIAFSMDVGEVSPVFTTHLGLHLCQVSERKPAEPIPFEEAREAVLTHYIDGHREKRVESFVAELKEKATITDEDPDHEEPAPTSVIFEP